MDETTCKPAFNDATPKRIVKVTPNKRNRNSTLGRAKERAYKPSPISASPLIKLDPNSKNTAPVIKLDVEKYLHQFKDFVMTEEEKLEVLNDLWNIMCRFVEIGFGMDSHTLVSTAE